MNRFLSVRWTDGGRMSSSTRTVFQSAGSSIHLRTFVATLLLRISIAVRVGARVQLVTVTGDRVKS
jgi:hypothetical protein